MYARWAALRFVCLFGSEVCSEPLQELANQIGIQHKKLRKILDELSVLQILKITFPEDRERSRVRHIVFNSELICGEGKIANKYTKAILNSHPGFRFINEILATSHNILVSNKQKNNKLFHEMIANDFMVLICLHYYSDHCGVVTLCGSPEIMWFTGLSKANIYKSITKLKRYGFIRSHTHGTINNTILESSAPIYALNLSHDFFGKSTIYGNFYITKFNEDYILEVQDAYNQFEYIRAYDTNVDREIDLDNSDLMSRFEPYYLNFARGKWKEYGISNLFKKSTKQLVKENNVLSTAYSLKANIFFLQSILEEWASRIFETRVYQIIKNDREPYFQVDYGDLLSKRNLSDFFYQEFLLDEIKPVSLYSERFKELNDSDRSQFYFFLLRILEKIMRVHLYFYGWYKFHQNKNVSSTPAGFQRIGVRVLPRTGDWAHVSCVFELALDPKVERNKFFVMKAEHGKTITPNESNFYEEIQPDLDVLKQFGLLDKSCLAIDNFPSNP